MKTINKILTGTAVVTGAYFGLIKTIDNFLVKRKWTFPESIQEAIANADLTDLAEASEKYRKQLDAIGYEKHCIMNDRGQKLAAWFIKAEKESDVYVLCSHGYRSEGKDEFSGIAQYYHKKGYNILLVDHVASGDSEGNIIGFGHYEAPDCIKWLEYLNKTFGKDIRIILHGVSMGAATVMMMSGDDNLPENVKMVVADCGYTSAIEEFDFKLKEMHLDKFPGILTVTNFINRKCAGYDFRDTDAHSGIRKTKLPILFIHGGGDLFVPTFMSHKNYEACQSEIKDLLIIEGADHAQSFVKDKEAYENKLDEFLVRAGIEEE